MFKKKRKTCPNEKIRKEHKYSLVKHTAIKRQAKNDFEVAFAKNINKY